MRAFRVGIYVCTYVPTRVMTVYCAYLPDTADLDNTKFSTIRVRDVMGLHRVSQLHLTNTITYAAIFN